MFSSFHGTFVALKVVISEARGRQDVHVSVFELVRPSSLPPTLHRGDLHFGWGHPLRVVGQSGGLRLHHLHGGRFLGSTVGLNSKACWEKKSAVNL